MSPSRGLLRTFLGKQWRALAGATIATVFVTAADLAKPWPLALVVDQLLLNREIPFRLSESDLWLLAGIAALVLLIALTDAVAQYCSDLWLKRAGERIIHDLRTAVYAHLQKLSLVFHQQRQKGDLVTRVTGDVNAVGELFSESLGTMAQAGLLLFGMLVVCVVLDPVLTLAAFAVVPILAAVTFRYRRKVKAVAKRQRAQEGEIASLADEALSAMPVVKAFGAEPLEHDRVERRSEKRLETGVEVSRTEARFTGLIDVLGAVATVLVIVVGVFRVSSGALSPGDLIVFGSYTRRLYRPLRDIARQASRASRAMARADRIAEILAADQILKDRPGAYSGGRAVGEIELEAVSFAYEPDRPALTDFSLRIPAGSRVAVVGRSGAGKSTLAALIARFYDPTSGRVLIDGRDARDCALSWLRDQVGVLLQDTVLFTGTVAENIAYATDAQHEDVIAAAKAAAAHGFISQLPRGYDTELGPQGVGLSGGQRQRLGIARTLLRDPPILVLDEPTAGLDAENEAQVLDGLDALMGGRTTILITHSVALARTADRVLVVDSGRVVEEGPPARLLARRGHFQRLAADQGLVARRNRPTTPRDAALPHMQWLLDAEAMAPILQRSLGRDATLEDVCVRYLRYKPNTNLVVHYEVAIDGDRHHDVVARIAAQSNLASEVNKPKNVAMARIVDGRSPAANPLTYDAELDAMIQWLPLDLSLPALAAPPADLYRRLKAAGIEITESTAEPRRIAYKPRRRAVLRLGGRVLKAYAQEAHFRAAVAGLRASTDADVVPTAAFETALPDLRLTVQATLDGLPPTRAIDVAGEAGATLRALRQLPVDDLTPTPPARQLAAAAESATLVKIIAPGLRKRIETLVSQLEAAAPVSDVVVPTHGDFHAGQLLRRGGELAVIDFDKLCAASPALDLATYAAHLVHGRDDDLSAAQAVLDAVVEGYGERPNALAWYLATSILRRAPFPFRYLEEHWPDRVEAMVNAAEAALSANR